MDGIKDIGKHIKYADTNKRAKLSNARYLITTILEIFYIFGVTSNMIAQRS